ncbi:hypothetical protein SELMODRAFT_431842 [Selaginella moellendorffii]|uniref:Uncharacterized protein n=1 Tax=Selaginella moellendorffii TaxID=88036 RepID=D8TDZ1_SELML|nr:hypothetical protein SELMODRAFT_431842 [Selaginella moellendorffii]
MTNGDFCSFPLLTDGRFANHVNLTDLDPIFKQLNEKTLWWSQCYKLDLASLGLAVVQEAVSKRSPGPSLEQKPLTSHPILEATTGCDFAGSLQSIQDKSSDFICCGANCSSNNVTATSLGKHSRIGEKIGIVVGSMAALVVALAGIYWRTKPCPDPTQGLEEQSG